MIDKLPHDVLFNILFIFNDINEVINISCINQKIYKILDNNFYIYWARHLYTDEFWKRANKRSKILSRPLPNMKLELLRLNQFDKIQRENGYELWKNEDYYKYWDGMEKTLSTKKNIIGIKKYGISFNNMSKLKFIYII